jgi:hypothetical protein
LIKGNNIIMEHRNSRLSLFGGGRYPQRHEGRASLHL